MDTGALFEGAPFCCSPTDYPDMKHAFQIALLMIAAGCGRDQPKTTDSVRVSLPDTLWLFAATAAQDAVHDADTEADLIARFGAENVRRDSVHVGEGKFAGLVLFPNDSLRRAEVSWRDPANRSRPERVSVRGATTKWVAFPGVSGGSCLEEIERINGAPFTLYGFGWDYGGTNDAWGNGRLDSLWGSKADKRVILRFGATIEPTPRALQGEKIHASTLPAMRAAKPCVRELIVRPR